MFNSEDCLLKKINFRCIFITFILSNRYHFQPFQEIVDDTQDIDFDDTRSKEDLKKEIVELRHRNSELEEQLKDLKLHHATCEKKSPYIRKQDSTVKKAAVSPGKDKSAAVKPQKKSVPQKVISILLSNPFYWMKPICQKIASTLAKP